MRDLATQRRASAGPAWAIALLAAAAAFVLIYLMMGPTLDRDHELMQHGGTVMGTVVSTDTSNHGQCSYSYAIAGKAYAHTQSRCPDGVRVGSRLQVHFVTNHPSVASVTPPTDDRASLLVVLVWCSIIVGVLAFLVAHQLSARGHAKPSGE